MSNTAAGNGVWGGPWMGGAGWYTGEAEQTPDAVPALLPVAVGSHEYTGRIERKVVEALRPSLDQAPEPGEVSLNNAGMWRRSQSDWRFGSNQLMFDEDSREEPSRRSRYWTAKGLNPHPDTPADAYQLRMHKDVQQSRSSGSGNFRLLVVNSRLYVVDGAEMYFTSALIGGGTTWTAAGISAASGGVAITGATTDGAYVYAACGSAGIVRSVVGSTVASPWTAGSHPAAKVSYANGRMLAFNGPNLWEVNAAGQVDGDTAADTGTLTAPTGTLATTSLSCTPLLQSYAGGASVTANYGGHTQTFTVAAGGAAVGATTIPINSAVPTFNFPVGTQLVGTYVAATGLLAFVHPVATFTWGGAVSTPHGIFCFGSSGIAGEMYLAGVDTTTGAMNAPQSMFILPVGESLNELCYYSGALILATSAGVRVATVIISFVISVQYGPVILITGGVNTIFGFGQWAYFAWSNYDATSTGLGRLDLARFAVELTPSMSSDLMAPVQGQVLAVCDFAGVRCFAVSGVGVYNEHPTNYVASGTIDVGRIKFGTTERKLPLFVDLYHVPLPAGASIAVATVDDFGTVTRGGVSSIAGSIHPPALIPVDVSAGAEHVELQLTVTNGTNRTVPPILRRWTLYALVTPHRVDQVDVIVPLARNVQLDQGGALGDQYYDVLAEWQYLRDLLESGAPVALRTGDLEESAYVADLAIKSNRWDPVDNHWVEGELTISLITLGSVT